MEKRSFWKKKVARFQRPFLSKCKKNRENNPAPYFYIPLNETN